MKKFYFLSLISIISMPVYSQSSSLTPAWVNNPQRYSDATHYCVSGSGSDRNKARLDAELSILSYYNNELSKSVKTELNQTQRSYYDIVATETMKVVSSSSSYGSINGIRIKEFWRNPANNIAFCFASNYRADVRLSDTDNTICYLVCMVFIHEQLLTEKLFDNQ